MSKLPTNRRWSITNSGEVFGTLYTTRNVSFDDEGAVTLSRKATSLYSSADDADFALPLAIEYFNSKYYVLTSDGLFSISNALAIAQVDSSPTTSVGSDAVVWQGRLYVTADTSLSYMAANESWTNSVGSLSLTTAKPHPLAVFENKNALAVANGNVVYLLNTSHSTIQTLTIPSDYEITTLRWRGFVLYIGTRTTNGNEAKLFLWNGSGSEAQQAYGAGSNWIFALEDYSASIVAVTNAGQILRFNGGGFDPLDNFPVYHSPYVWSSGSRKVCNRGVRADGDVLYINIQGTVARPLTVGATTISDGFYLPNQPSGVWCFDPKVGLYPRNLSTTDPLSLVAVSSVSDSTLTLASSHNLTVGEPVHVDENGSITGIADDTTYYAIPVAATTLKLAASPADAQDGTHITLAGTAGSAVVRIMAYQHFGEGTALEAAAGALQVTQADSGSPQIFPEIVNTPYIWGFGAFDGSHHLNCLTLGKNVGSITLNRLWASGRKAAFNAIEAKHSLLVRTGDALTVRTATRERLGLPTPPLAGTFSNTNTIGSDATALNQVRKGDQLTILAGPGAGTTYSITKRSGAECVLSGEVPGASSAATVVFLVRAMDGTRIELDGTDGFSCFHVGKVAVSLQAEIEMRGHDVRIDEVEIINKPHSIS